ncbi:hypothetical protein JYT20_01750, partial [Rhodothermus sp. AH-315-K08]|nr:hypothetical protein [Rhodothermus sp. AH-315-K08]
MPFQRIINQGLAMMCLGCSVALPPAHAQTLLADINETPLLSRPAQLTYHDGHFFLGVLTSLGGKRLHVFSADGLGERRLEDIPDEPHVIIGSYGEWLFALTSNGRGGKHLWSTDGERAHLLGPDLKSAIAIGDIGAGFVFSTGPPNAGLFVSDGESVRRLLDGRGLGFHGGFVADQTAYVTTFSE